MIVLSPRAVERLESYRPPWPIPKIFRLTKGGKLVEGIFRGETINTPSMLCVEDVLDALRWAEQVGGRAGLIARAEGNLAAVAGWVAATGWVDFLAAEANTRSCTSVCLTITDPWCAEQPEAARRAVAKAVAELLEGQAVAFDINGHREAPPGLRIWTGATIERADIEALLPWLDWAYAAVKSRAPATV